MKLGFYYHVPVKQVDDKIYIPSYLGVFLDSLAQNVDSLKLFMHEASPHEEKELDYALKSANITLVNLAQRKPAWHRSFFYKKSLEKFRNELNTCDCLLVRGPSPLAPYFHNYVDRKKIVFMVVGDYKEGARNYKLDSVRNIFITLYLLLNDRAFDREISRSNILVNSESLFQRYKDSAYGIKRIRTTTLSESDFMKRTDTCTGNVIELIYTGRIDKAKGLFELIQATCILNAKGINTRLHIVGWELKSGGAIEGELKDYSQKLNIPGKVVFHGKKTVGEELNQMYRMADIYVIPSYHEGFPRTIWEAMANSLPVIATPVGGIPYALTDMENVLFTEVKNDQALARNIETLIKNKELRQKLIANGYKLAGENTLEKQTQRLVESIREYMKQA